MYLLGVTFLVMLAFLRQKICLSSLRFVQALLDYKLGKRNSSIDRQVKLDGFELQLAA
jgi:hypothetical protein